MGIPIPGKIVFILKQAQQRQVKLHVQVFFFFMGFPGLSISPVYKSAWKSFSSTSPNEILVSAWDFYLHDQCKKLGKILSFMVNSDVYRCSNPIKSTFIQWISKLPGSFEIHQVKQYLVNFTSPAGIVNTIVHKTKPIFAGLGYGKLSWILILPNLVYACISPPNSSLLFCEFFRPNYKIMLMPFFEVSLILDIVVQLLWICKVSWSIISSFWSLTHTPLGGAAVILTSNYQTHIKYFWSIFCEIDLMWMPLNFIKKERSLGNKPLPYGITKPQWVKDDLLLAL